MTGVLSLVAAAAAAPTWLATVPADRVEGISEPLKVLEDLHDPGGPIVFEGSSIRIVLRRSGEPQVPIDGAKLWGGLSIDAIRSDESDLLGNLLLESSAEPTYGQVAGVAPPLIAESVKCGDYDLQGQTFVGSRVVAQKHLFDPNGNMENDDVPQRYHLNGAELKMDNLSVGLLGDWMPALRHSWALADGGRAEQIAFAPLESTDARPLNVAGQQPVWLRYLNVSASGELRHVVYVDSHENYPNYCPAASPRASSPAVGRQLECDGERATAFYGDLLAFARAWNTTFEVERAMAVAVPEQGIDAAAFAKHSVARMLMTRKDTFFPSYGAPPMYYGHCCDGFQDVLVADLATYLEWGLFGTARGILDNFFTFYARRGAGVNYRGPEMAQYGRTLTLVAQYNRWTGDDALLLKHSAKLLDIGGMLLARRRAAQRLPRSDPSYGLIRGVDESDEVFSGGGWSANTSELPHFSFSLEAWRGFSELGPIWSRLGKAKRRADLQAAGQRLSNETSSLLADVVRAVSRSAVNSSAANSSFGGLTCHPYVAGEPTCADMGNLPAVSGTTAPYNDRASEPWRSYSGMLYSGGLDADVVGEIVRYNRNRSRLSRLGIWSGVGGFDNSLMSFTEQGHGYGLLQHDHIEPFLLQFFAEMAHACTRGSWTCFESRRLPQGTPAGGYTTPSQSIVPLHLKWMLVWEEPLGRRDITLCRGTPRAWMNHGERIKVDGAPTSLGRVSFNVTSALGAGAPAIAAGVRLDAAAGREEEPQGRVTLRLRAPLEWALASVVLNGAAWADFDAAAETVALPRQLGNGAPVDVVASYRRAAKQ